MAPDFMQRRHESFAEEVERILRGKSLRKSKSSMRRKSLLKISNEVGSSKVKCRLGLKFPGKFSALFLKNIGKSTEKIHKKIVRKISKIRKFLNLIEIEKGL